MCKSVRGFGSILPPCPAISQIPRNPANRPANHELAGRRATYAAESAVPRTAYDPRNRRAYRPTSTICPTVAAGSASATERASLGAQVAPRLGVRGRFPMVAAHPKRSKSAATLTRFRSHSLAAPVAPRLAGGKRCRRLRGYVVRVGIGAGGTGRRWRPSMALCRAGGGALPPHFVSCASSTAYCWVSCLPS